MVGDAVEGAVSDKGSGAVLRGRGHGRLKSGDHCGKLRVEGN